MIFIHNIEMKISATNTSGTFDSTCEVRMHKIASKDKWGSSKFEVIDSSERNLFQKSIKLDFQPSKEIY